jgi:cyanate lyase
VANASGKSGVAARTASELEALGYPAVAALNADDVVATSVVYYAPNQEAAARQVATDLALDPDSIASLDTAPGVKRLAVVDVLVLIGTDRA